MFYSGLRPLVYKKYSGSRPLVYKKYTLKEPDSRFAAYRPFGVQKHLE
jgi:hypothetical protein